MGNTLKAPRHQANQHHHKHQATHRHKHRAKKFRHTRRHKYHGGVHPLSKVVNANPFGAPPKKISPKKISPILLRKPSPPRGKATRNSGNSRTILEPMKRMDNINEEEEE